MGGTGRLERNLPRPAVVAALAIGAVLAACALLADVMAARPALQAQPSLLSLLVHGARATLALALVASSLSLAAGVLIGAAAGWGGRTWDRSLTRMVELVAAFPAVVLVAIVHSFAATPSVFVLGAAIALIRACEVARLVRVQVIAWQGSELAMAARAIGATTTSTVVRHMGPHLAGVLAQTAVSSVSAAIVIEMLVEFLGLGAGGSAPTWGATLARAVAAGDDSTAAAALAASVVTVAAAQILAEHVRESFDPHARRATPCTPRA